MNKTSNVEWKLKIILTYIRCRMAGWLPSSSPSPFSSLFSSFIIIKYRPWMVWLDGKRTNTHWFSLGILAAQDISRSPHMTQQPERWHNKFPITHWAVNEKLNLPNSSIMEVRNQIIDMSSCSCWFRSAVYIHSDTSSTVSVAGEC